MSLRVTDIYTSYGLSQVLFGVSLQVNEGEVVSLLGRNGVGKSTTLRSIMGLTPPHAGSILWKRQELIGKQPYQIANLGIGFVPEDRRIFADLTVWENLDVAVKTAITRRPIWTIERVFELFPALELIKSRKGGFLSGGEQQMLTIARTLMGNPELLLLDEPSEGLAPIVVQQLGEQIKKLQAEGMTILLSEQNAKFSLQLSSRFYILEKGVIRYQGTSAEFWKNEEIFKSYLAI